MTGFRHVTGLRAYSGGTVPDSHRIHYSPRLPEGMTPALQRILMALAYSIFFGLSIAGHRIRSFFA